MRTRKNRKVATNMWAIRQWDEEHKGYRNDMMGWCGIEIEEYPEGDEDNRFEFADPGGKSALRASSRRNPRNLPCPTCKAPNRLTPADRQRGYQCDSCADRDEGGRKG